MKTCPFCQVENRDDAQRCRFCGRELDPWAAPTQEDAPEPTQPIRPAGRERQTGSTQPLPPSNQPRPRVNEYGTPAYGGGPAYNPASSGGAYPPQGGYPPAANNAPPYSGAPSGAGGYPPYSPPGNQQSYAQPYPVRPKPRSDRAWMILVGALAMLLLCSGGAAVWIITTSAAGGLSRAGAQLSTQAAGAFGANNTPEPTSAAQLAPSPWPTFTTAPTFTPEATAMPTDTPPVEVTQAASLEKYLTPECAAALDQLENLSKAVTEQPALPLDAAWRGELGAAVGEVRAQCGSLDKASPVPGIMGQAQQDLDQATHEFDEANRLFKEGIDEFKPGKVFEAGQHLAEATKYLNQALGELRKIGG